MQKSTATALHQNEISETWVDKGIRFQFQIGSEAVDHIKTEVIRGLKSIPKRGAEVGGILFGSLSAQGSNCVIQVEHIFPVPVEYRYGPSYRLSEIDEKAFSRALHAWPERKSIGWYRSNTRTANEPAPDDYAITASNFPQENVFLFLKPDPNGAISATVEVSGRVKHTFLFGRFSFLDRVLQSAENEQEDENALAVFDTQGRVHQLAIPSENSPEKFPLDFPEKPFGKLPAEPPVRRTFGATQIAIASAVVCGGVAVWALLRPQPVAVTPEAAPVSKPEAAPANPAPSLGLRAEYQGKGLLIHWDRQSPVIQSASDAVFTMQQGQQRRLIPLDAATLHSGGLLVRPTSSDLDLRLDVHTGNITTSQSLRVIDFRAPGLPQNSSTSPAGSAAPAQAPAQTQFPARAQSSGQSSLPAESQSIVEVQNLRDEPLAKTPANKPAVVALDAPPEVAATPLNPVLRNTLPQVLPALRNTPAPNSSTSRSAGGPANLPASNAPASNAPASNAAVVAGRAPVTPESASGYVPAKVIRKVQPQPPSNIRNVITGNGYSDAASGQVVGVEIQINERGLVTSARVTSSSGPFARSFEKSCLDAAKQWQFEPARSASKPVPSRLILTFNFNKAR